MNYKSLTAGLLGGLLAVSAAADVLRMDEIESYKVGDNTLAIAFHSSRNCRVWQYIPGTQFTGGEFQHNTAVWLEQFGAQELPVATTSLTLTTKGRIDGLVLQGLRQQIFNKMTKLKPQDRCSGTVATLEDIHLSPAMVIARPLTAGSAPTFYSLLAPQFADGDGKSRFDPTNPIRVDYVLDAIDPSTQKKLSNLQAGSSRGEVSVGYIGYHVDGVLARIDSKVTAVGHFTGRFKSQIVSRGCTTSGEVYDLSNAMPVVSEVKVGGLSLSRKTKKCLTELVTNYTGGDVKVHLETNHDDSSFEVNGVPMTIEKCELAEDKDDCMVPLKDYVEDDLNTKFLTANFDLIIKTLKDNTMVATLGRQGEAKTTFDLLVGYKINVEGLMGIAIPVVAQGLDARSFDFTYLNEPEFICAQKNFRKQTLAFGSKSKPTPIANSCIGAAQ